jgi:hypothetical protein
VNWQTAVALIIVAIAAAGLLWPLVRRRRKFSFERDTHCGCSTPSDSASSSSIIFHARKGERPRIIVKSK